MAITPTQRQGWVEEVMAELRESAPLTEWPFAATDIIEAVSDGELITMWRTPLGFHYEAQHPDGSGDVAEMERWEHTGTVKVLGDFLDLGTVDYENGSPPTTTITFGKRGQWVKVG